MPQIQGQRTRIAKLYWRCFFWLGIFAVIFGTGMSTAYINQGVQAQTYLFGGFTTIALGFALMAAGVLVSKQIHAI
jgi:hypothetical protein